MHSRLARPQCQGLLSSPSLLPWPHLPWRSNAGLSCGLDPVYLTCLLDPLCAQETVSGSWRCGPGPPPAGTLSGPGVPASPREVLACSPHSSRGFPKRRREWGPRPAAGRANSTPQLLASCTPGTQRERALCGQAHACLPTPAHGFSRLPRLAGLPCPLMVTAPPSLCAHENR